MGTYIIIVQYSVFPHVCKLLLAHKAAQNINYSQKVDLRCFVS